MIFSGEQLIIYDGICQQSGLWGQRCHIRNNAATRLETEKGAVPMIGLILNL